MNILALSYFTSMILSFIFEYGSMSYYEHGYTDNKKKLNNSFNFYINVLSKKSNRNPNITVWCDNKSMTGCKQASIEINKENIELIKQCLISRKWDLVFHKDPEIDFEKLRITNGDYMCYESGFYIDYIQGGR